MNITVTPAAGGAVTFAEPVVNFDSIAGRYRDKFLPEGPNYGIEENAAPMTAITTTRHGFRGRTIRCTVWYVAATEAALLALLATDEAAFNQSCSVSDGTTTYAACEARPWRFLDGPFGTELNTCMALVAWEFRQLRTS